MTSKETETSPEKEGVLKTVEEKTIKHIMIQGELFLVMDEVGESDNYSEENSEAEELFTEINETNNTKISITASEKFENGIEDDFQISNSASLAAFNKTPVDDLVMTTDLELNKAPLLEEAQLDQSMLEMFKTTPLVDDIYYSSSEEDTSISVSTRKRSEKNIDSISNENSKVDLLYMNNVFSSQEELVLNLINQFRDGHIVTVVQKNKEQESLETMNNGNLKFNVHKTLPLKSKIAEFKKNILNGHEKALDKINFDHPPTSVEFAKKHKLKDLKIILHKLNINNTEISKNINKYNIHKYKIPLKKTREKLKQQQIPDLMRLVLLKLRNFSDIYATMVEHKIKTVNIPKNVYNHFKKASHQISQNADLKIVCTRSDNQITKRNTKEQNSSEKVKDSKTMKRKKSSENDYSKMKKRIKPSEKDDDIKTMRRNSSEKNYDSKTKIRSKSSEKDGKLENKSEISNRSKQTRESNIKNYLDITDKQIENSKKELVDHSKIITESSQSQLPSFIQNGKSNLSTSLMVGLKKKPFIHIKNDKTFTDTAVTALTKTQLPSEIGKNCGKSLFDIALDNATMQLSVLHKKKNKNRRNSVDVTKNFQNQLTFNEQSEEDIKVNLPNNTITNSLQNNSSSLAKPEKKSNNKKTERLVISSSLWCPSPKQICKVQPESLCKQTSKEGSLNRQGTKDKRAGDVKQKTAKKTILAVKSDCKDKMTRSSKTSERKNTVSSENPVKDVTIPPSTSQSIVSDLTHNRFVHMIEESSKTIENYNSTGSVPGYGWCKTESVNFRTHSKNSPVKNFKEPMENETCESRSLENDHFVSTNGY